MQLKQYQTDTLAILRRFFEEARIAGPDAAYQVIVNEPEQMARLGRYAGAYSSVEGIAGSALRLSAVADRRWKDPACGPRHCCRPRCVD